MSLPASDYWFSLTVRRNRKSFLIGTLFLFGVMAAVLGGLYFFDVGKRASIILLVIFGLPWIFVSYNLTGWLTLLWVPINVLQNNHSELSSALSLAFWIVLVFVPGTKGENRYGADPLEEF